MGEDSWVSLPSLWTHSSLPDTTEEVATQAIVEAHPHVKHLAHHFPTKVENAGVILLIGHNCGTAMFTESFGQTAPFATTQSWAGLWWDPPVLAASLRLGDVSERPSNVNTISRQKQRYPTLVFPTFLSFSRPSRKTPMTSYLGCRERTRNFSILSVGE